jgi:arylformamidase
MDRREYGAEEIEPQFDPRRSVPGFEDHQARHAAWSAAARRKLDGYLDVAYGAAAQIDMFPAPGVSDAPVHVFLHGGYWRAQDKANFAHGARRSSAER